MKSFILLFSLLCSITLFAQRSLDTIYANDRKNVALFFPDPVRQGITGASHFVFTYNREKEQYFGLLQAKPGPESNLIVVTNTGEVYSYILKYSDSLSKLDYFIDPNESIGNERRPMETMDAQATRPAPDGDRIDYFKRAGEYLLRSKYNSMAMKSVGGIRLRLLKMVYDASEVYLVMEIRNGSLIDFEIDYLNVYRTNGDNRRKASYQRLVQEILYGHKLPDLVLKGLAYRFVFVLPKFVLGENEKLLLELKERNGSRKVVMETGL